VESGLSSEDIVSKLRQEVFETSGLTCSAGIAPNKMLAKIASNMNKPNGQYYLEGTVEKVQEFVRTARLARINGIGKVTAKILEGVLGATTAGQLFEQRLWVKLLFTEIQANFLLRCSLGIGSTSHSDHDSERQSMSTERTFPTIRKLDEMLSVLKGLCEELSKQLEMEGLAGKNIGIKMKSSDFAVITRVTTVKCFIWSSEDLFSHAKGLLVKNHPTDLRLLGVRLASLGSTEEIETEESIQNFIVRVEHDEELAKCPICLKPIAGTSESASPEAQQLVNDHVDMCLARVASEQSSQPTNPKPEKLILQQKSFSVSSKRASGTLDVFFRKVDKRTKK